MMVGLYILSIILYGAAHKLDIRQRTKYGHHHHHHHHVSTTEPDDLTFVQYQSTIGMFGPKHWYNRTNTFHHHRDPTKTDRTATNQALLQQKRDEEPIQSTEALLDSTLAATEEEMFR